MRSEGKDTHHKLEDILARPMVRRLLRRTMKMNNEGTSFFERLCENYDNPELRGLERWKWRLSEWLIDRALKKARIDKRNMTEKLFHHQPTARALALTGRSIARYGLSAPQRFVGPLMVVWNMTQACNLRCRHCYQNATARPAPDELTLEEKLQAVDQMGEVGTAFLAIAGGEPLVSKHLWPVLERARERRIHTTLATNGTMLSPANVARLIEAGVKYVEVSVDSVSPEEHDTLRGHPGAWERAVQGIRNAVAAGMRTGFATCLTRRTVDTVDELVEFAISLGCRTFSHFNFIPVGRGREMIEADMTPTQREWLLTRLVHHLQQERIAVFSTAPQFGRACAAFAPADGVFSTGHVGLGRGGQTKVLARYLGGCGAGRCYCAIQPNGDITPCVYISTVKVGTLRCQTLQEIWDSTPVFDLLSDREQRLHNCAVCESKAYCGGCRARALAYTDDIRAGDPGCKFNEYVWDEVLATSGDFPILAEPAHQAREAR